MTFNVSVFIFAVLLTSALFVSTAPADPAAQKLHALFNDDWQFNLNEFPESATLLGDSRYNARLADLSFEAIKRRQAHDRDMLQRIEQIDRAQLAGQDVISYDLFLLDKKQSVAGQRFHSEYMPIDQMNGIQVSFGQLMSNTPLRTAKDYEDYIARLRAFPAQIDQLIALMQRGLETGWVQPVVPLRSLPKQINGQIPTDVKVSPFFKAFANFPQDVSPADRDRLAAEGEKAIAEAFVPAMVKLEAYVSGVYIPAARQSIGASELPDGVAYYQQCIRRYTTTDLTADQIHEIGLKEVARIRGEMERVIQKAAFKGTFAEFLTFLRTDKRFYYDNADDLIAGYALIAKHADAALPKLFAELPRTPYGIGVIPDYEAPAQTTAYYQPSAADGSRAGLYMVNTYKLETRPKFEMEALSLHESVPGHHLQIARAQELQGLPDFRRNGEYTAYIEGWALYAESLGDEMGFYQDPYSKFGQLSYEMWRACRLVVDTGIHAKGWSRQRAIDYMKENTAKTENDITVEIDRYIVWPGQALAYKIGELKIQELRTRAKNKLGAKFDIRKFHNALLDDGPLPLDLLEKRIDGWIEQTANQK